MSAKTGGPAFPYSFPDGRKDDYNVAYGMTLRDYFAAKAMAQLMLSSFVVQDDARTTASWAYEYADAMLKARES
jgi:hypothetical protein